MPIKRDSNGNIIDEETRRTDASTKPHPTASPTTPPAGRDKSYDAVTELAGTAKRKKPESESETDDAPTRIYRPGHPAKETRATPDAPDPVTEPGKTAKNPMDDPPVGWLVVVRGPGKGSVLTVGNGTNSIGRDAAERLSLDFGDEMISRTKHAIISYDPRGKKFYIQHGGGTNLTYLDDHPVLAPEELPPNTDILIGNTTLRFFPLCGEQFNWDTEA